MKNIWNYLIIPLLSVLLLVGCTDSEETSHIDIETENETQEVTTETQTQTQEETTE